MSVRAAVLLGALLLGTGGCGGAPDALQDAASCPGDECTDDTRARYDAIASLDGVSDVRVSRDHGLDRGAARRAEVTADVPTLRAARDLGLAVMRELEDWPGHADGPAVVVVRSPAAADGRELTLRLDGDWVCEQPTRVLRPCTAEDSWLVSGERVANSNSDNSRSD